jgi:ferritin-like metal-binding protein YciE
MAAQTERDLKLVQYLNEAYGKEKELEVALQAHLGMTDRAAYKKRLRKHLTETKGHARALERRIKALGGSPAVTQRVAGRATAALKGQVHAFRAAGEEERLLKNAKTEYSEEAEEIATYTAIEAFAESVGDRETVKLAKGIRREEERMATYLAGLIPQLARATARAQVPSDQRPKARRRTSGGPKKASASTSGARRRTGGGRKASVRATGRRTGAAARRSGRSTTSTRSRRPSRR